MSGKMPSFRDLLTNSLIGYANKSINSFRRFVGMLFGPEALLFPNSKIMDFISASLQGVIENLLFTVKLRN